MRDTERPGRGARATTGGALLGLAAGLSACNPAPDEDATIELVQVERDLLADPPEWDVRRAHPERAPEVAVICPTLRSELDGADLLALVMPPPCEVRFTIDADVPPSFLRLRAGMDLTVAQRFGERASGRFLFEVLVDGRSVYRSARRPREGRGSAWEDVGGSAGWRFVRGPRSL